MGFGYSKIKKYENCPLQINMLSLRMRMRMKIASMCWGHCIILVSDTCLIYMTSWRVFKRTFFSLSGDCKCRKLTNDFVQSGIYWLMWLASIGRFLALFDLQVIHLSEHCLLVLLFSTWSLFSVTLSIWRQRCRLSYMTCNKYLPKRETLFFFYHWYQFLKNYLALAGSHGHPVPKGIG